jgi:L,D-transpeptidase ErfK/SrfK
VRKVKDPVWYPTANTRKDRPELPAQIGPGPDNPLGDRALYFGWPTYLMHGTNKPFGVGRRVSRGCIRLYPEVSRHLYDTVPIGTKVRVVNQGIKVGWHAGELFIEVHPDFSQLEELEETYSFEPTPAPASFEVARQKVEARVGDDIDRVHWQVVEAELVARRGIPVQITGAVTSAQRPTPQPAYRRAIPPLDRERVRMTIPGRGETGAPGARGSIY